jgi:hypothetical protein
MKIVSKEYLGKKPVFDLFLDSEPHNFVLANNINKFTDIQLLDFLNNNNFINYLLYKYLDDKIQQYYDKEIIDRQYSYIYLFSKHEKNRLLNQEKKNDLKIKVKLDLQLEEEFKEQFFNDFDIFLENLETNNTTNEKKYIFFKLQVDFLLKYIHLNNNLIQKYLNYTSKKRNLIYKIFNTYYNYYNYYRIINYDKFLFVFDRQMFYHLVIDDNFLIEYLEYVIHYNKQYTSIGRIPSIAQEYFNNNGGNYELDIIKYQKFINDFTLK